MERQLEEAKEAGAMVIPVAHHNLLKESTLYPEECTLENNREVIDLLEEYHFTCIHKRASSSSEDQEECQGTIGGRGVRNL